MRTTTTALLLLCTAPAFAQSAGQVAEDAAMTPAEDVNIRKKDIPPVLLAATKDPYVATDTRSCAGIAGAITALTEVLGPDFDSEATRKNGLGPTRIAKGVVGSFIPFRGVVREISGAAAAQRRYDVAVDAGIARRGYLRGVARSKGCKPVA